MPPRGHAPCGFVLFDRTRHVPSIARRPPSAQAQASGAIVTPGGKAEREINKALDKAPDGPARFARLMKGDDPKTVMTPPAAGGTKDGKTDQDRAAGAPGVKAEGKTPERTPPISTRREAQPGSQPEGNAATSNPSKAGEGPPDAGQARRQRLQDLTSGIADLEDRMKRAETRREESALIREASRLHAERERLGAAQESRVPEASAPDAPGLSARQVDEALPPHEKEACLTLGLARALGLNVREGRDFPALTLEAADKERLRLLLELLYHPAVKPGMTRSELDTALAGAGVIATPEPVR